MIAKTIHFVKVSLMILLTGCSSNKYYTTTCNGKGYSLLSKKDLLVHLDTVGFICRNNKASIKIIKDKTVIEKIKRIYK